MRSETVEQVLESLACSAAGGRVGAAQHAALGTALVARVARHAEREGAPEHADSAARGCAGADELRAAVLRLADGDPAVEERDVGTEAGAVARARAAVRVIDVVERALALAETARSVGPRAVVTDVAAAAETLRAAAGTARVDVEVDLIGITDPEVREELLAAIEPVDDIVLRAAKLTAVVREQILR